MSAKTEHSDAAESTSDEILTLAANETSRVVRRFAHDAADELHGVFRVRIFPGDNRASLFVPFAPAFEFDPKIEYEQVSGPEGTIKLAGCFPHGLRLEVKVAEPRPVDEGGEQEDVVLELFVRAQADELQRTAR